MFPGLGMSEILVLAIIGLVVIGPKNLPKVASSLGKGYKEFRKAMTDLKEAVDIKDTPQDSASAKLKKVHEDNWKDKIVSPEEQAQPAEKAEKKESENNNEKGA